MKASKTILLAACIGAALAAPTVRAENEYDMAHARPLASGHASDPNLKPCVHPDPAVGSGWCLYTSQDMGFKSDATGFMMGYTRAFFSKDGVTFEDEGIALTEDQYTWVPRNSFHLWAPTFGIELIRGTYNYYLYVPDVIGSNVNTDSAIGVSVSTNPFGPFSPASQQYVKPRVGYMSDPDIFPAGADTTGTRYLLWADGNGDTCGGISIAPMKDMFTIDDTQVTRIKFNGDAMKSELGTCSPKVKVPGYTPFDGPYLEGPSLYEVAKDLPTLHLNPAQKYMLVFPSKPSKVPSVCTGEGEPNKDNQVIAYATSDSITGPYDYRGIIMCGSATEWTNHMNLAELKTPGGSPRQVIYYHDSADSSTAPHRKLLAECLYAVDGKIALIDRDTRDGLSWCMSNSTVFALKTASGNGKYVQENSYDGGNLRVRSNRVGVWEQFTVTPLANGQWGIQARLTRQYVSANFDSSGRLAANRDAIRDWEKFNIIRNSDGTVSLQVTGPSGARYVRVNGDQLLADQSTSSGAEKFRMVNLWDN